MPNPARHYIDGEWVASPDTGTDEIKDPATQEPIGRAYLGSEALADQAVAAARSAFRTTAWASEPRLRADVLDEFADRLAAAAEEMTELLVRENGKLRSQAAHEIAAGVSEARYYSGLARNICGRTIETGTGKLSLLTREPCGVVSVIVPWNAPVTLLVRSVAPALAAGCTVVIKPAPQTPLIHSAVIACFDSIAALPRGVVNSVNENGRAVGSVLSSHPEIDAVSFTGSTRTGRAVMASASQTIKRVSLELGGKSPAIVFSDADMERAVAEIFRASVVMAGQMCTAVSRVLVHEEVVADFTASLAASYRTIQMGHGLSPVSQMGPLIDLQNRDRVEKLVERAADESDLIVKGAVPPGDLSRGAFFSPTMARIDDPLHFLAQEEHFAPLVTLETFSDEESALRSANATRFGLAASLYTRDLDRALRVSRGLQYGTVWLNCHNRLFAEAETGGYRESGSGRLHGLDGLGEFLETKHIYLEVPD